MRLSEKVDIYSIAMHNFSCEDCMVTSGAKETWMLVIIEWKWIKDYKVDIPCAIGAGRVTAEEEN